MCGSYFAGPDAFFMAAEELDIDEAVIPDYPARVVVPSDFSCLIANIDNKAKIAESSFGFLNQGKLVINARSESVDAKPLFASSFENRRCIIPAYTFFEWDENKNRAEFKIPNEKVIYLAGIWNVIENVSRFVILTTAANKSVSPIHDRMPIMISPKDLSLWLFDKDFAKDYLSRPMPNLSYSMEEEQLHF